MNNRYICKEEDLVTTYEQTRAGFLNIALEKNLISNSYVKNAMAFKSMCRNINSVEELYNIKEVRPFMLTAAGLSDKSLLYLNDEDKDIAIEELIEKFLKPAGDDFLDEAIYRYLLIKGDAVGGIMRNRIGALGQEKFIRTLLSCINVRGIKFGWMPNERRAKWQQGNDNDLDIEKNLKLIHWENHGKRTMGLNLNIPIVKKNVDICLFDSDIENYVNGETIKNIDKAILMGELKGGVDPAGADEHWKSGKMALDRIKTKYLEKGHQIKTVFIAAAIEKAMAKEIYEQLESGELTNAANINNQDQLVDFCNWLLDL